MKKFSLIITMITTMIGGLSCSQNDPEPSNSDPMDTTDIDTVVQTGTFMNGVHIVQGMVRIVESDGSLLVILEEDFTTQSGPDLKVYLSTDLEANNYIRLGALKSTSGKQMYTIPIQANVDFNEHKYILIWCEAFSVLFGSAEL